MRTDERHATFTIRLADVLNSARERLIAKIASEVQERPDVIQLVVQTGWEVVATLSDAEVDSIVRNDGDTLEHQRDGIVEEVEPRTLIYWHLEAWLCGDIDEAYGGFRYRSPSEIVASLQAMCRSGGRCRSPVEITQPDLF